MRPYNVNLLYLLFENRQRKIKFYKLDCTIGAIMGQTNFCLFYKTL